VTHAIQVPDGLSYTDDIANGFSDIDEISLTATEKANLPSYIQDKDIDLLLTFNNSFAKKNVIINEGFVTQHVGTVIKNIDDKIFFVELDLSKIFTRFMSYEGGLLSPYWGIKSLNSADITSNVDDLYKLLRHDAAVLPGWSDGKFFAEIPFEDYSSPEKIYAWFGRVGNQPLSESQALNISSHYFEGAGFQNIHS